MCLASKRVRAQSRTFQEQITTSRMPTPARWHSSLVPSAYVYLPYLVGNIGSPELVGIIVSHRPAQRHILNDQAAPCGSSPLLHTMSCVVYGLGEATEGEVLVAWSERTWTISIRAIRS